jgi:hypothetical protein
MVHGYPPAQEFGRPVMRVQDTAEIAGNHGKRSERQTIHARCARILNIIILLIEIK